MTREEAKEFLLFIANKLGYIGVEDLTDRDGKRMIEAIKALEEPQWIPCSERLPNANARAMEWGITMSGWGIAETAPVIEKIKAESADYLRGLNSCGDITWSVYDKAFDFYMELISRAYEQGKKDAQPHWIPCSERLPEKAYGQYWVCTDTGFQCQCRWTDNVYGLGSSGEWAWKIFDIPQYSHVIAWMPLPEPWRGDAEWVINLRGYLTRHQRKLQRILNDM